MVWYGMVNVNLYSALSQSLYDAVHFTAVNQGI